MRRVVVTGLGMVTPLACGVEQTWQRLLDGKMLITVVGKPQGVTSKDVSAAGSGG